jgi:protein tyrosine phosphatase (PTP) superfamily phosphohydrolase (DUF442 family)
MLLGAIMVTAVGGAAWMVWLDRHNRLHWDHWDVVKHGILYRSGQLTSDQLTQAVRQYGIRTVVNFQLPGEEMHRERELARQLGVNFLNLPMPGDGFGEEAQFREVLKAIDDPDRRPVLVHCARGTCRTGSAVALYRYERDGWTVKDVAAEMRRQTYREGWIPGYIFAMCKVKPDSVLHDPVTIDDRVPSEAPDDRATSEAPIAEEADHVH